MCVCVCVCVCLFVCCIYVWMCLCVRVCTHIPNEVRREIRGCRPVVGHFPHTLAFLGVRIYLQNPRIQTKCSIFTFLRIISIEAHAICNIQSTKQIILAHTSKLNPAASTHRSRSSVRDLGRFVEISSGTPPGIPDPLAIGLTPSLLSEPKATPSPDRILLFGSILGKYNPFLIPVENHPSPQRLRV